MFGVDGIGIAPVIFTESKTEVEGIKFEYHIDGSRVQFHLWPNPEFPEDTAEKLSMGLKSFPQDTVVIDFVPEVESWYVEVNSLSISPTDTLVESIIKKIAKVVNGNG